MRRLFIIRKDLHLSAGKLAAMVSHCAEAYWTNLLKHAWKNAKDESLAETSDNCIRMPVEVDSDIWDEYVNKIFTKTICECRNLNQLKKVEIYVSDVNAELPDDKKLVEGVDYGYINDSCFTELTPENEDGTCTVGIWFRPLPDEIAHKISKKYMLYRG